MQTLWSQWAGGGSCLATYGAGGDISDCLAKATGHWLFLRKLGKNILSIELVKWLEEKDTYSVAFNSLRPLTFAKGWFLQSSPTQAWHTEDHDVNINQVPELESVTCKDYTTSELCLLGINCSRSKFSYLYFGACFIEEAVC